jgi:myo-inositol catabolism protein IolC
MTGCYQTINDWMKDLIQALQLQCSRDNLEIAAVNELIQYIKEKVEKATSQHTCERILSLINSLNSIGSNPKFCSLLENSSENHIIQRNLIKNSIHQLQPNQKRKLILGLKAIDSNVNKSFSIEYFSPIAISFVQDFLQNLKPPNYE